MPSDVEFIRDFTEEDKLTFAFGEQLLIKTYNMTPKFSKSLNRCSKIGMLNGSLQWI